jgi:NAD(P)H dehydrogenase (quinone)
MHGLVVTAHPLPDSLCATTTRRTVDARGRAGRTVVLEDRSASGFEAATTAEERASDSRGPFEGRSVAARIERPLAAQAMVVDRLAMSAGESVRGA